MNPQPDIELARFNMVEQQVRTWEVLDQRVLDLLLRVHREEYVPPHTARSRSPTWRSRSGTEK